MSLLKDNNELQQKKGAAYNCITPAAACRSEQQSDIYVSLVLIFMSKHNNYLLNMCSVH